MNKTVKIILIAFGILFLLSATVCGGGYLWLRSQQDELAEEGHRLRLEADEFAKNSDQEGCVTEALRRMNDCDPGDLTGAICRGKQGAFLTGCLRKAMPTQGFCDGVPPPTEIMEMINWSLKRCAAADRANNQACAKMYGSVASYCAKKSEARSPSSPPQN